MCSWRNDIPALSRDLGQARRAYEEKDTDLSIAAHLLRPVNYNEQATESHTHSTGKYLKSFVYGALDGIITTFALVSGAAGAKLHSHVILVLGLANLIADGISMGLGDYVSSKAECDYQSCEKERERWELDSFPEGEVAEMIELYVSKGFSLDDATVIINTMSKYKEFFVDHMLVQELGILPPDEDDSPATNGLVTLTSFLWFGSIPLAAFLVLMSFGCTDFNMLFGIACALTGLTLLFLGAVQGHLAGSGVIRSAILVLLNGTIAAGAAYVIGHVLTSIVAGKSINE